jgi:superfamily I DNA/RNA helicase
MQPTDQQRLILDYADNAVIIAAPGSGKTFVVSEKVRDILKTCPSHKGVVAISYTKKASGELRERCLKNGFDPKSSFFGTIDKFYLGEIIIPFGKHIWRSTTNEFSIPSIDKMDEIQQQNLSWVDRDNPLSEVSEQQLECLKILFLSGIIAIETVGILANFVFGQSKASNNYLKAKYKAIFIDEYQDCGANQHSLFEKIISLGITGVAVGDLNQSIYAFSGKSSKYLSALTGLEYFKTFKLDKNHRCDNSIINYSNYLLDPNIELIPVEKSMVKSYKINGNEIQIAQWIDSTIPTIAKQGIKNNQIAILTRGSRTAELISQNLKTSNKIIITTDLDMSLTIWAGIFSNLLRFAFDPTFRFLEVIEDYISLDKIDLASRRRLVEYRESVKTLFNKPDLNIPETVKLFTAIAEFLAPNSKHPDPIHLLTQVLSLKSQLEAYKPTSENDVNIMTLHKSKGLEFDVVYHMDMHEWVFPSKAPGPNNDFNNPVYNDYLQDLNLHYVGITRARKACLLITSTQRTNNRGTTSNSSDSEFLMKGGIEKLRV